jgi:hypothetical protein
MKLDFTACLEEYSGALYQLLSFMSWGLQQMAGNMDHIHGLDSGVHVWPIIPNTLKVMHCLTLLLSPLASRLALVRVNQSFVLIILY